VAAQVEAVADEELVRHGEPDVADGEIRHEPSIRPVEQGNCGQRARLAKAERLHDEVEGHARVDDVFDQDHVPALDVERKVLEESHPAAAATISLVGGKRDEVEAVEDRERAREIRDEDDRGPEGGDEDRLASLVVGGDRGAELFDPRPDVLSGEIDVPDPRINLL
jgi:hypothetical protein